MTTQQPGQLPPTNPYGTDFWLGSASPTAPLDFDPSMRLTTGRQLLSQNIVSRLSTARGTVIDCPNDCYDVRDLLSDGMTQSQINALFGQVQQEIEKDQRVQSASVTGSYSAQTSTLTLSIAIQSLYGPFPLTLAITAVSVSILDANLPTSP